MTKRSLPASQLEIFGRANLSSSTNVNQTSIALPSFSIRAITLMEQLDVENSGKKTGGLARPHLFSDPLAQARHTFSTPNHNTAAAHQLLNTTSATAFRHRTRAAGEYKELSPQRQRFLPDSRCQRVVTKRVGGINAITAQFLCLICAGPIGAGTGLRRRGSCLWCSFPHIRRPGLGARAAR